MNIRTDAVVDALMPHREFGEWLGKTIEHQGLTHEEVANGIGLTQPQITKWCNGKAVPRRAIHIVLLGKILHEDPLEIAVRANFDNTGHRIEETYSFLHLTFSEWSTPEFLIEARRQIAIAHEDWRAGNPERAALSLERLIKQLDQRLQY